MAWLRRLSAALRPRAAAWSRPPASAAQDNARLDRTVRYLQDVQHKRRRLRRARGQPIFSSWAAMAFASAGINPRDQRKPGGVDVYTYLTRNTDGLTETTEFARVILVARAAGTSPRTFGKIDPRARGFAGLQRPDGGFPQPPAQPDSQVNATAFAILALRPGKARAHAREPGGGLAAGQAGDGRLVRRRHRSDRRGDRGAERRRAAATPPHRPRRLRICARVRTPTAASAQALPGEISNTASTSWVVRALVAAGIDATRWWRRGPAKTPLDYLAAMQQPDGSVRNSPPTTRTRVWTTTFAAPALAGASLPMAAVDREKRNPQRQHRPAAGAHARRRRHAAAVRGGTADGGDGDVTAGGGGQGAPLFSQPAARQPGPGAGRRATSAPTPSTRPGRAAAWPASRWPASWSAAARWPLPARAAAWAPHPGLRAAAAGGEAPRRWLVAAIGVALVLSAPAAAC